MKTLVLKNDELFENTIALLKEGKKVTIPVKGYSMLPFIIGERDLVVLEDPDGKVSIDDIVLFKLCGRYILHRVIDIRGDKVLIQGDGILKNQERCTLDDIHGRVVTILRNGKRPVEPYTPSMIRKVHAWQKLGMLRRWPLAFLRRMPGIKSKTM